MKGSYILLVKLDESKTIQIGKIGIITFKKGFYAYVGSALNGLEQRINRHLRRDKKNYWHVDYLLNYGEIVDIFYNVNDTREECNFVKKFEERLPLVSNFGCSDCNCKSHLFYGSKIQIINIINSLEMFQYC